MIARNPNVLKVEIVHHTYNIISPESLMLITPDLSSVTNIFLLNQNLSVEFVGCIHIASVIRKPTA